MMHTWTGAMGLAVEAGPFHWIAFAVIVALILYPVGRILKRIGFSPLWSVLVFIPLANLLALWLLAMGDWPREEQKRA